MTGLVITGALIVALLCVAVIMGEVAPETRAHGAVLPLCFILVVNALIWVTLNEAGL